MSVFFALLLDALLGEPKWLWSRVPHPAVLMGRVIDACDKRFNRGEAQKRNGVLTMAGLASAAALIGWLIALIPGIWADVIVGAILLAQRSLVEHVSAVQTGLILSIDEGRKAVAMIVGRDTNQMDRDDIARSAIESGAENLSDGVIAPAFCMLIAGVPGLLVYKITNTADSMIGYRTPRHAQFGWAAARFDDVLNWAPARITAGLIWLTDRRSAPWTLIADAGKHRSPNAGWPEAAMAHAHQIALSGPRSYDGQMTDDPYVNVAGRKALRPSDIGAVVKTMWIVWTMALVTCLLVGAVSS